MKFKKKQRNVFCLSCLVLFMVIILPKQEVLGVMMMPWIKSSYVETHYYQNQDGTWTYNYTVFNDSYESPQGVEPFVPYIVDWEIPYFDTSGITFVTSPSNDWAWSIENIGQPNPLTGWGGEARWLDPNDPSFVPDNPFNSATKVLHWYVANNNQDAWIAPGESQNGFSITASFGPDDGPYQTSWAVGPPVAGDPAEPYGSVNMPSAPVPIPGTGSLLVLGAWGLFGIHKKRW